jgi:hypothetical protein
MKNKTLTLGVLFIIQSVCCQAQNLGDWIVSVNAGIEAHDKRLFNYSEKESLLDMQSELWGTYHTGLGIRRKVWQSNRFSSFLGLGVNYEHATFLRPFDHLYFKEDSSKILLYQNRYEKYQANLSILVLYKLGSRWFLSGDLTSYLLLFRSIEHSEIDSDFLQYMNSTFELDDIQLRLGVNHQIGRWVIGLRSRLFNFQKIDRVIFNNLIKDPRMDQKWEWNNPLRFDLTIGYTW